MFFFLPTLGAGKIISPRLLLIAFVPAPLPSGQFCSGLGRSGGGVALGRRLRLARSVACGGSLVLFVCLFCGGSCVSFAVCSCLCLSVRSCGRSLRVACSCACFLSRSRVVPAPASVCRSCLGGLCPWCRFLRSFSGSSGGRLSGFVVRLRSWLLRSPVRRLGLFPAPRLGVRRFSGWWLPARVVPLVRSGSLFLRSRLGFVGFARPCRRAWSLGLFLFALVRSPALVAWCGLSGRWLVLCRVVSAERNFK